MTTALHSKPTKTKQMFTTIELFFWPIQAISTAP